MLVILQYVGWRRTLLVSIVPIIQTSGNHPEKGFTKPILCGMIALGQFETILT